MSSPASADAEQLAAPEAAPPAAGRFDVFVSYSRRDGAFVRRLHEALESRGKDAWVDWEDIPATTLWRDRIRDGIESANAFLFVLSPDSVASPECAIEVDVAVEANKRIVPVVHRDVDPASTRPELANVMWLSFRDGDDFAASLDALVEALETDQEWLVAHTRLLNRAREWESSGKDRSFLLLRTDLGAAESWLRTQEGHKEAATALQIDYIVASRQSSTKRQRITLGAVTLALLVALGLTALALVLRQQAVDREETARSREFAAQAEAQVGGDPLMALYLARRAFETKPTTEAEAALRHALQTPLRAVLAVPAEKVRFSGDGRRIVTITDAGDVRVWEAVGGTEVRSLRVRDGFADAALSPDAERVATVDTDGRVRVWPLDDVDADPVSLGQAGRFGAAVAFSSDGRRLVAVGHDTSYSLPGWVRVWDLTASPPPLLVARHERSVVDALLSPDGHRLLSVGQVGDLFSERYTLRIGGVEDGPPDVRTPIGRSAPPAFSPDGTRVATGGHDGTIQVWETTRAAAPVVLRGHAGGIVSVAFSPDGTRLVSAGEDETVRVWDLEGRAKPLVLPGRGSTLVGASFVDDGRVVVVGGEDRTIRIWNLALGRAPALARTDDSEGIETAAFSPDGRRVVTIGTDAVVHDGTVRVWAVGPSAATVGKGTVPTVIVGDGPVHAAAFSPDGRWIVTAGFYGNVVVSDASGREQPRVLEGEGFAQDWTAAFSPDGRQVVLGGEDGIRLWAWRDDTQASPLPYDFTAMGAAFSPDGQRIVGVAQGGAVLVWGLSPPRELRVFDVGAGPVYRSGLSPDGRLVAIPNIDGTVAVWDIADERRLVRLTGHEQDVYSASFSPDGRLLVTAGADGTVRVWDWASHRSLAVLRGHDGAVEPASFSPDGEHVVSGGYDGTVRVWTWAADVAPVVLRGHKGIVRAVSFSPDGRQIVSAGDDGTTRIWTCEACLQIEDVYRLAREIVPREPAPAVRGTFPAPISG